ncbi:MAG: hypothetical protein R3242_00055 [Akkermansiaceae bacterium]|nr:hypothetical protein [Akkermansiaceae bacterium]
MNRDKTVPESQLVMTMWIIWFFILSGLFVIALVMAPELKTVEKLAGPMQFPPLALIGIAAVLLGLIMRFVVVPSCKTLQTKLPFMIAGLALCEGCGFIALFVLNDELVQLRGLLFWLSIASVVLSAPLYARAKSKAASPFHQS